MSDEYRDSDDYLADDEDDGIEFADCIDCPVCGTINDCDNMNCRACGSYMRLDDALLDDDTDA